MNFDHLGQELLQQQPLLSSQIIPELADDDLTINKSVKPQAIIGKPVVGSHSNVYKLVQANISNATPVQIKSNVINQHMATQKVQIVKKMPTNVVQVAESKSIVKQNTIINENVITNSPIVINKVNGNISGKSHTQPLNDIKT